jgi:hypothetical protein
MNAQPAWRRRALLLVLLSLFCAAGLVGCGGGGSSPATGGSGGGPPPPPTDPTEPANPTDVVTYKYDLARTGANLTESVLTQANVTSATFGLQRVLSADGKVDAITGFWFSSYMNLRANNVPADGIARSGWWTSNQSNFSQDGSWWARIRKM